MKRNHVGFLVVGLGVLMLLSRGGPGSMFIELVRLGALGMLGVVAWRYLVPRVNLTTRLVVLGVIAIIAASSLKYLAGSAFLAFIALAFWLLYATPRPGANPWALIPAGVLATLSLVAGLGSVFPGWNSGAVFSLGLTVVFTAVYLLPKESGGGRWALWPALAWGFITVLANDPGGMPPWLLPLLLIGGGVVLLGWTRRGRHR